VNFIAAGYSVDAQDLVVINHVVSLAVLECNRTLRRVSDGLACLAYLIQTRLSFEARCSGLR
jgi:hypothetical protein